MLPASLASADAATALRLDPTEAGVEAASATLAASLASADAGVDPASACASSTVAATPAAIAASLVLDLPSGPLSPITWKCRRSTLDLSNSRRLNASTSECTLVAERGGGANSGE